MLLTSVSVPRTSVSKSRMGIPFSSSFVVIKQKCMNSAWCLVGAQFMPTEMELTVQKHKGPRAIFEPWKGTGKGSL